MLLNNLYKHLSGSTVFSAYNLVVIRRMLTAVILLVTVLCVHTNAFAQFDSTDTSITVVRAYFDSREMVDEMARDYAPWEVHHDNGYLVIGVNETERQDLVSRGFRIETDVALTNYYDTAPPRAAIAGIPGYPCYRTVEETFATARDLVASNPGFAKWIDIGDSWEKSNGRAGYDLWVLKLTNESIVGPKPAIFQMTAVHAREYSTAELNTRFAEYLLKNYGIDPDVTWLLDHHEFHLLLQANPDGRKQAEGGSLWRKNFNQNACLFVPSRRGIDLNRNFSYNWGCCGGSSNSQCSETYHGPSSGSEVETKAITQYLKSIFQDQRPADPNSPAPAETSGIFLDTHSYSELILWPWGYTENSAPNGAALTALGRKLAQFNGYKPSQVPDLYIVDGGTLDYTYGEFGIASYTFEIGTAFFQDCPTFERDIYPDNLQALIYASKVARAPYIHGQGPDAIQLTLSNDSVDRGNPITISASLDDTRYNNSNGTQPTHNIESAEAYVDTPPWVDGAQRISMTAVDGSFDENVESVQGVIDTAGLDTGQHTVFVRGRDASGNWGAVSALFFNVQAGVDNPSLIVSDTVVNENDGFADITVRLTESASRTVRVTASTRAGTAESGSDFNGRSARLTIEPGQISQNFRVAIVNDDKNESVESFVVLLTDAENADIQDGQGVVTINDDDDSNTDIKLSIENHSVTEDAGTAQVTVRLDRASTENISVRAFTQPLTATAGLDFYGKSERISFNPGQTEKKFNVVILDDDLTEPSETIRLRLLNPSGGATIDVDNAVLTITDDDNRAVLSAASLTINESSTAATVELRLSREVDNATVSAQVFTQARTARGGSDYYGFTRQIRFEPGVTQQYVTVPILDDSIPESDEKFAVRFNNVINAKAGNTGIVTIIDND